MINRKKFRGSSKVNLKIRLRKSKGTKPTRDEVIEALDFIIENGHAPDGWTFDAIDWEHPKSRGAGGIPDMQAFRSLLEEMRDDLQIAIVRK